MLDWLAVYEIDPWGEDRQDLRSAVQSLWNRGTNFDEAKILWPYHRKGNDALAAEDDAEIIAAIEEEVKRSEHAEA